MAQTYKTHNFRDLAFFSLIFSAASIANDMPQTGLPVIFLAFANDQENRSRYLRGLAQELRGIRKALQPARRGKAVEIVERSNASLGDIIDVFQDPAYAGRICVFHYGGHAESYSLLLEDEASGQNRIAHSDGLVQFLAQQGSLQLLFLNGCSTESQAHAFQQAGIPHVIATNQAIDDQIAQRFAIRFYKGLGAYQGIAKSYQDAINEVLTGTAPGQTRTLYFVEEGTESEDTHEGYPWLMLPQNPTDWQLASPGGFQQLAVQNLRIGKYAHVFCDRHEQNDEFASQHIGGKGTTPQVYILFGHRDERHESLITRFSYYYVGKRQQYIRPVDVGTWPVTGNKQNLLKVRLAEQFPGLNSLGKPIKQLTGTDLINHVSVSGREAILLQHSIPLEEWDRSTQELLSWYLDDFWKVDKPHPEAPKFVIFINVRYSQDVQKRGGIGGLFSRKSPKEKALESLEEISKQSPDRCLVMSRLVHIRKPHVDDWLSQTNIDELEEYFDFSDRVFTVENKEVDKLRMKFVEKQLRGAVETLRNTYAISQM